MRFPTEVEPPLSPAMAPTATSRAVSRVAWLLISLLPALVLVVSSIELNHFALIDDGVTLLNARRSFFEGFLPKGNGRYVPFYFGFHWLLMQVFPERPWPFSLANGVLLLLAAWQVQRLARTLGGPWAGVVGAWLFVLSLSTVENIFTLGKAEPKQLVFWLAALMLMARALEAKDDGLTRFEPLLMLVCTASTLLFKETGVLLWLPLAGFAALTVKDWNQLSVAHRSRRRRLLITATIPLTASSVFVLAYGLRAGSYARDHVIGGSLTVGQFQPSLPSHDPQLAVVLVGGLVGGTFLLTRAAVPRGLAVVLWLQLLAIVGFFAAIRTEVVYYYYPGVALAAILLSAALLNPECRGLVRKTAAWSVVALLIVCGIGRVTAGASALAGWSWLYDRLTGTVVAERPLRVFFHQAGSWETHVEADLVWRELHGVSVWVGVLDTKPEPHVPAVTRRDLRQGDWIMEQFGTVLNTQVPFRDLGAARSTEHALVDHADRTLLPIRLLHEYRAGIPVPRADFTPGPSPISYLHWRIYQVTAAPRLVLEGLDVDHWMYESARMWIRIGEHGPVTLRFTPYVHVPAGGDFENELMIYAGKHLLTRCRAATHRVQQCTFDPPLPGVAHRVGEWNLLELRATKTFSPRLLGLTADMRQLSFNFGPTWSRGIAGLFDTGDASEPRDARVPSARSSR